MKKQILTFVGLLIVLTVISVTAINAQSGTTGKAHIPFDFSVWDQNRSAGDYEINRTNGLWMLNNVGDNWGIFLLTNPNEAKNSPNLGKLIFRRYGDRYFLAAFETSYYKIEVRKSAAERNLEKEIKNDRLAKNSLTGKVEFVVIKSSI